MRVCVCRHTPLTIMEYSPKSSLPLLSIYAISEDDPHILPLSTQYSSSNTTTKVAVVLQVLLLLPLPLIISSKPNDTVLYGSQ